IHGRLELEAERLTQGESRRLRRGVERIHLVAPHVELEAEVPGHRNVGKRDERDTPPSRRECGGLVESGGVAGLALHRPPRYRTRRPGASRTKGREARAKRANLSPLSSSSVRSRRLSRPRLCVARVSCNSAPEARTGPMPRRSTAPTRRHLRCIVLTGLVACG